MAVHFAIRDSARRQPVQVGGLLAAALARVRRQKQYARVLSRGGTAGAGLDRLLAGAADCVGALARSEVALRAVSTRLDGYGVEIAGRVTLNDPRLAQDIGRGARVTAYLLTLGYSQADAFEWLGRDYAAHHVQTDLAGEVLFALGRHAHRLQQADHPGRKLRRLTVQVSDVCGGRSLWDPAGVQALIGCFDGINPGVTVTDTGCFQPLNSLLGLTVGL